MRAIDASDTLTKKKRGSEPRGDGPCPRVTRDYHCSIYFFTYNPTNAFTSQRFVKRNVCSFQESKILMTTPPRKYFTEAALNIYSTDPAILSPADLDKQVTASPEESEKLKNTNIYMILKRPRISFVPDSLKIESDRRLSGEIAVQLQDKMSAFPFTSHSPLPDEVGSVDLQYPFTRLTFFNDTGEKLVRAPIAFLLRNFEVSLNEIDSQEVVYVGQAFGEDGERTAIERLSSHATLQKILADISANEPHCEVLLALYCFEFHQFILSMDGRNEVEIKGEDDRLHRDKILDAELSRSLRISLAEAALIRYFEPRYNKIYKTGFPHKRYQMLKELYELDFAALVVEASIEDHEMSLFSKKCSPASHHIAKFDLHDKASRKSFFFDKP